MKLTKRQAKEALGLSTDADFSRLLGITKQAVSQMPEDEAIPEGRQWQLRALHPDRIPEPKAEAA